MSEQYIRIPQNAFTRIVGVILTFRFVAFAWIFFRARDFGVASEMVGRIGKLSFQLEHWRAVIAAYQNVLIMLAGFVTHFLPESFAQRSPGLSSQKF